MGEIVAPFDDKAFLRYIQTLADRIRALETTRQLGTSTVAGTLQVTGGTLAVVDPDTGITVAELGQIDGTTGWVLRRDDGTPAITLDGAAGAQHVAVHDRDGHIVAGDDAGGEGLARPYVPLTGVPATWHTTRQQTTTSGTFVPLWTISGRRQHPRIEALLLAVCDPGVAAELRMVDPSSGDVLAGPTAVAAGGFEHVWLTGTPPAVWDAWFKVDIQMRVSSGAGTVGSTLIHHAGIPST